jgi:hypothetical protein
MAARFLIAALIAAAASAQSIDKTLYSAHAETPSDLQTLVNVVRTIGEIQRVSMDVAHKAITVTGDAGQVAVAEWLCSELDHPTAVQPTAEYRMQGGDASIVRVYYLANITTPQGLQEAVNSVRSIADVQRFLPDFSLHAIVMRGTRDQAAAVDWLLHELDQNTPPDNSQNFPMPGLSDQVVKIFALKHATTPQALQEAVNLTRSIADIQRFFPYSLRNEIVARGTAEQIALAGWLLQQLDQPPAATATPPAEYRLPGNYSPVVRVAYLSAATTPVSLQETVNAVRTATSMQRIFPNNFRKAIAMRGTADQVSRADLLIKERDQ